MPRPPMSLAVVGADFPNKSGPSRRFELRLCLPNEPVELRPEPKNPADPRAVAVFSARGVQIGYLTAERCGLIGGLIAGGADIVAIFQAQTSWGAWIRVSFDGAPPLLPAAIEDQDDDSAAADDGFWPDPEWPDI